MEEALKYTVRWQLRLRLENAAVATVHSAIRHARKSDIYIFLFLNHSDRYCNLLESIVNQGVLDYTIVYNSIVYNS